MSVLTEDLPIITKQTKVKGKKRVFTNTNFKAYLYKEYEITFNSGEKEYMYSVALEIPIEIIKERIVKELNLFGLKIPLITEKTIVKKHCFLEIPFRLVSEDFYAIYCPSNYVNSHNQVIEIKDYGDLENLKYNEKFTKKNLNKIKEVVKQINFEVIK